MEGELNILKDFGAFEAFAKPQANGLMAFPILNKTN